MPDSPPITFLMKRNNAGRRVWHIAEHLDDGSICVRQLENLAITGDCFSYHGPWPGEEPGSKLWQYASDGRLTVTGVSGSIHQAEANEGARQIGDYAEIRIGPNFKPGALPWEVLIMQQGIPLDRHGVGTFHIKGVARTAMEIMDGGPKWYIGCRGSFRLDGTHAVIRTNP